MPRIALGLEYDGTEFAGWQAQANARSVQTELERVVSRVAAHDVTVNAAGRTDAGVHALGQVAHFDSAAARTAEQWRQGINSGLPADASVRWVAQVCDEFDARRSAQSRRYVYLIQQGPAPSSLARRFAWWLRGPLDHVAMHTAAQDWLGEHDFSAFRAAGCQSHTPMRCLYAAKVTTRADFVMLQFTANAFLYHMVRNFVGTLVQIGLHRQPVEWAGRILAGRDRTRAGATAPACGLTLAAVSYEKRYAIPAPAPSLWLEDGGHT
jgi:tRNA pseudouridine38-40 synthase